MKKMNRIFSMILVVCILFSMNSLKLFAASGNDNDIVMPCADETQTKSKTWTIKITNSGGVTVTTVTVKMTGIYSLADKSLREITDFTYSKSGIYSNLFTVYADKTGLYERRLRINCDGSEILRLNFVFQANANMLITTSKYYGQSTVTITHQF